MTDIAFDPDGNLFGLSFTNLYSIDATTAEVSLIGTHGIEGGNALVFGRDGTLYGAGANTTNLFSVDTTTGLGTSLGSTGFMSGGDLAFQGENLFLASRSNELVSIDLTDLPSSTAVGPFGVNEIFGIATDATGVVYATANTTIFTVNTMTGAATNPVSFSGQGLGNAFGQAFFAEAGAPPMDMPTTAVPLPAGLPLLLTGLLGMGAIARRRKAA